MVERRCGDSEEGVEEAARGSTVLNSWPRYPFSHLYCAFMKSEVHVVIFLFTQ